MSQAEDLIEFCLTYRSQIEAAVLEAKMGTGGAGHTGGMGSGHCRVSDPTAIKAIRLLSPVTAVDVPFGPFIAGARERVHLRHPEKWLQVVKAVEQRFLPSTGKAGEFYRSRYCDRDLWRRTCTDLHITHGVYYAYRKEVIYYAALFAVQLGLAEPTPYGLKLIK